MAGNEGFFANAPEPREDIARRKLLKGGLAALLGGGALYGGSRLLPQAEGLVPEGADGGMSPERLVSALGESRLFRERVFAYMARCELPNIEGPEPMIERTRENSRKLVEGLDVSFKEYLEAHIMKGDAVKDIPPTVRNGIKTFISGLASEESRFSNRAWQEGRDPDKTARGILQIMPDTYRALGATDETILDFPTQVEIANKHFMTIYRRLRQKAGAELDAIRDTYYPGDQARFEREFMTLAVIDSYHAGQDTIVGNLKRHAAGEFALPESSSVDLYTAFAYAAARPDSMYSDFSAGYTQRVAAFTLLHLGYHAS